MHGHGSDEPARPNLVQPDVNKLFTNDAGYGAGRAAVLQWQSIQVGSFTVVIQTLMDEVWAGEGPAKMVPAEDQLKTGHRCNGVASESKGCRLGCETAATFKYAVEESKDSNIPALWTI